MVAPQEIKRRGKKETTADQIWKLVQEAVQTRGRGTGGATLDDTLKEYADLALAERTPVKPTTAVPVVVDPETQKKIKMDEKALGWVLAMTESFDRAAKNNDPKRVKLEDSAMVG